MLKNLNEQILAIKINGEIVHYKSVEAAYNNRIFGVFKQEYVRDVQPYTNSDYYQVYNFIFLDKNGEETNLIIDDWEVQSSRIGKYLKDDVSKMHRIIHAPNVMRGFGVHNLFNIIDPTGELRKIYCFGLEDLVAHIFHLSDLETWNDFDQSREILRLNKQLEHYKSKNVELQEEIKELNTRLETYEEE